MEARAPRSRPSDMARYGWPLEKVRVPPIAVNTPRAASTQVPRLGASSTPATTTVSGGRVAGSGCAAAAEPSSMIMTKAFIARCS